MRDATYSTRLAPVHSLTDGMRRAMANLYLANYDGSSESRFLSDLANKQDVLLLHYNDDLVGFTTLKFYERNWNDAPINVVYSGDTVVLREHWGQQALAFAWIAYMGVIKRESPTIPLYWFLLVKGHRTYRYLPVFGKSFYPHWNVDRRDLKPLADMLATEMFPDEYNPATGIIEFPESCGHLKPDIALPTSDERDRDGVRYFLEKNPGYRRGHELVCICEIEEHNMKPLTLRLFRKHIRAA